MKLKTLSSNLFEEIFSRCGIINITDDSKKADKNTAFFALIGKVHNGNNYIKSALENGCKCIFTDSIDAYENMNETGNIYLVDNARMALALASIAIFKEAPSNILAVTGTNGKSSVAHYICSIISSLGQKAASIGTLGINIYENGVIIEESPANLTTLDSISFSKELMSLKQRGIDYCAVEASSIGLDQYRMYGRKFISMGFTSFSQDHLDYHLNMEEYLNAKLKLFSEYGDNSSLSIINSEIRELAEIEEFLKKNNVKFATFGKNGQYQYKIISQNPDSSIFEISADSKTFKVNTKIIGGFQIENICMAALMVRNLKFDLSDIIKTLENIKEPKGRLERVGKHNIFIDYAHTPDALEKALEELKKLKANDAKLIVIFGCGGNRDKSKRPVMGNVAAKLADIVIVTDDNPRDEDPGVIRKEVIAENQDFIEIADRKAAIEYGIGIMTGGDILLIAGKGHEEYQIIKGEKLYFSDLKTALNMVD